MLYGGRQHLSLLQYPEIRDRLIMLDGWSKTCLLYTSDAADERSSVDLGGRRIIKKKKKEGHEESTRTTDSYT